MKVGDKVRALSRLGALDPDSDRPAFMPWQVEPGEVLDYAGPHPTLRHWSMLLVERDGATYEVPAVEGDHFEAAV